MATITGTSGNDSLIGTEADDLLEGYGGNDTLDGRHGIDTLNGGDGDDTYIAGFNDVIIDSSGIDNIQHIGGSGFTLPDGIENLTVKTFNKAYGTGNNLDNVITLILNYHKRFYYFDDAPNPLKGFGGNDTLIGTNYGDLLDGGTGNDTLNGGDGDDIYIVDSASDVTIDSKGIDTVKAAINWTLAEGLENLTLTGNAITGTGNSLDNVITGNSKNNILNGGAGNDTYIVNNTGDVINDTSGIDLIQSAINWTLAEGLENLTLTGSATSGTGNSLNNVITGNRLNNTFSGAGGNDILFGGGSSAGEIDQFTGGSGRDSFILGLSEKFLYNDGNSSNTGNGDYALIQDFNSSEDVIQLYNKAADYILSAAPSGLPTGTAIYRKGTVNELIGIIAGVSGLSLNDSYFRFTNTVNLSEIASGKGGFGINGEAAYHYSGSSVSNAGDVNGDGLDDLIIGVPNAGKSYVVFGKTNNTAVDLSAVASGTGGFTINGEAAGDRSGFSVSSAGDVNGDGLDDLIVSAYYADSSGRTDAGKSYVVFGKTNTTAVNLSAVASGTGGFVLSGEAEFDYSGISVSDAGDVNGDGLDDLIIGASGADPSGRSDAGKSYVVFGKTNTTAVDLSTIASGVGGFSINGQAAYQNSGISVSNAGDVNGDGLDDLIISGNRTSFNAGKSYVVFGKADGTTVDLNTVASGSGGFLINGQDAFSYFGVANDIVTNSASAGDVNGDGLDDLIIGGGAIDSLKKSQGGKAYVVFGKTDGNTVDLKALDSGIGGFAIYGDQVSNLSYGQEVYFSSVSGAGDINGDGLDDLIVGASYADPSGRTNAGKSYVVFGKTDGNAVDLNAPASSDRFLITGQAVGDNSGLSVNNAGDVNGDGFNDLIVGANGADPSGKADAGKSYVMYGSNLTGAVSQVGTNSADTLTGTAAGESLVGGRGNDVLLGNGGADVLYAGAGNDLLAINNTSFKRLDGGSGIDILRFDGAGINLNLTTLANNKLSSIETINLTGSGNNSLTLGKLDLQHLSDITNQLIVMGNGGDAVSSIGQGWITNGTTTIGSDVFNSYTQGNSILLVDSDITRNIS